MSESNLVLVIDDDALTRRIAETALCRRGYRVETSGDGRQALRWLEREQPAVIVTDIFMPEVDGLEVIMAARRACPQARILAISGGGMRMDKDFLPIARRLGADAALAKPFRAGMLLAEVDDLARAEPAPAVA